MARWMGQHSLHMSAVLKDAYEPSALVKCVYRGVDLALGALDGSTIQVSELTQSLGQLR